MVHFNCLWEFLFVCVCIRERNGGIKILVIDDVNTYEDNRNYYNTNIDNSSDNDYDKTMMNILKQYRITPSVIITVIMINNVGNDDKKKNNNNKYDVVIIVVISSDCSYNNNMIITLIIITDIIIP